MNYRINTKVISLVTILFVVVIGLFFYSFVTAPTSTEVVETASTSNQTFTEEKLLTARHQFVDGVHTIAGTAEVPTPCHRLVAEPFFTNTEKTEVEIRFNTLLEGEECPSEPFDAGFRVTFEAPEGARLTATWNGSPARLNLVPVQAGENLEDPAFIKG